MKNESGDYVIVNNSGQTEYVKILVLLDGTHLSVVTAASLFNGGEQVVFEVSEQDVLCNLGRKPCAGKILGHDTGVPEELADGERLLVVRYAQLEPEQRNAYNALFKKVMRNHVIGRDLYRQQLTIHLRLATSDAKRCTYKHKDRLLTIFVHPICVDAESIRLLSALMHPVWNHMTKVEQEPWLQRYAACSNVEFHSARFILQTVQKRVELGRKEWNAEADDDEREAFKLWVDYCKRHKRLSQTQVDDALTTGMWEQLLPAEALPTTHSTMLITEQGQKNCETFFCETMAYYLELSAESVGDLRTLCEDTLKLDLLSLEQDFYDNLMRREEERYLPSVARDGYDD